MNPEELRQYLQNPNVRRMLDVISQAEGTDKYGYNTAFGGGQLESLADHPRKLYDFTQTDGKANKTSAAGRYQFLQRTWDDVAGQLGLKDFGPESQDLGAIELLRRAGALEPAAMGDFQTALQRSGGTWASLPSSPYAQPKRSEGFMAQALNKAAEAVFPAAQAAEVPKGGFDLSSMSDEDLLAALNADQPSNDLSSMSDEELMAALGKSEPVSGNPIVALGAGLGAGVGQVAMGAQEWLGKGLRGVGADTIGNWLVEDAEKGRAKLSGELAPYKEASPISSTVGEIGGNIAAVAPPLRAAGAALGAAGKLIPGLGSLGQAVTSAGLRSGGLTGVKGLATRTAGGAISGGVAAGLVDPESAGEGALIGGALPGAWSGLSKVGAATGRAIRGSDVPEGIRAAAQTARAAGYVVPPTQARPTLVNSLLEGIGGKLKVAQQASSRNQQATNRLAKEALGLPQDVQLSDDLLATLRKQAGESYQNLRAIGTIQADDTFNAALDAIEKSYQGAGRSFPGLAETGVTDLVGSLRRPSFDAGDALDAIAVLRDRAERAYRSGDNIVGKASKQAASALEEMIERATSASGDPKAVEQMRNARQLIAKTYTVNKALNKSTGNVDASKIAAELKKGKPLSGELRQIGEVAAAFPRATQRVEQIGGIPITSPLDWLGTGVVSMATQNPLAAAVMFARPALRQAALSGPVQNRLAAALAERQASPLLTGAQNRLAEFAFRSAPLLSTSR